MHLSGHLAGRVGSTSAHSDAEPVTGERAAGRDRGRLQRQGGRAAGGVVLPARVNVRARERAASPKRLDGNLFPLLRSPSPGVPERLLPRRQAAPLSKDRRKCANRPHCSNSSFVPKKFLKFGRCGHCVYGITAVSSALRETDLTLRLGEHGGNVDGRQRLLRSLCRYSSFGMIHDSSCRHRDTSFLTYRHMGGTLCRIGSQ
jgi:hypothetical protein